METATEHKIETNTEKKRSSCPYCGGTCHSRCKQASLPLLIIVMYWSLVWSFIRLLSSFATPLHERLPKDAHVVLQWFFVLIPLYLWHVINGFLPFILWLPFTALCFIVASSIAVFYKETLCLKWKKRFRDIETYAMDYYPDFRNIHDDIHMAQKYIPEVLLEIKHFIEK